MRSVTIPKGKRVCQDMMGADCAAESSDKMNTY